MGLLGALGDLVLALSADTAKFQSDLGRADRIAKKFGQEVGRSMDSLAKQIALLAGAGSIGALIKSQIDAADAAGKMAEKIGISVESFSALKYAAEISEVGVETLEKAMRKLAVNMVDTQAGTGEAREAFRALGISVVDAGGKLKQGDDILLELADSFKGMEGGAGKAAIASKLFGERVGTQLIPFLNLGKAGIEQLKKEAERLGVVFSSEAAKAADEFNDSLTRLSNATKGIAIQISGPLVNALNAAATAFVEARDRGDGFLATLGNILHRLSMGSDLHIMQREMAGLGDALGHARKEVEEAQRLVREVHPALAGQAEKRVLVAVARLKQIEDRMKVLQGIMRDPFAAPSGAHDGARTPEGPKVPAPRIFTDAELKQMRDGTQAFIDALGGPLVQAAEEAQNRLEDMVFTWNAAGERIEMTKKEYEELGKIQQAVIASFVESAELSVVASEEMIYTWDEFGNRIAMTKEAFSELNKVTQKNLEFANSLGLTFTSAFEDAIINGAKFRDVLKGIEQDIARIILRQGVTIPVANAIGSTISTWFPTGKALGGPVSSGTPYMVGERGPELFVPSISGTVVPNGSLGGGGVAIYQTINVDSRSDQASIFMAMQRAKDAAVAEVTARQQRKGDSRI
jgi:hypothetical protein